MEGTAKSVCYSVKIIVREPDDSVKEICLEIPFALSTAEEIMSRWFTDGLKYRPNANNFDDYDTYPPHRILKICIRKVDGKAN